MVENKKSNEAKDYKERFEFRLTVGDFIICQRYFKINNFNPASIRSYELIDTIRSCANRIDSDLKDKTQVYLSIVAPKMFESLEEMKTYFMDEYNRESMMLGEGIVVRGSQKDYFWNGESASVCDYKFDDGEFNTTLTDEDFVDYKFSFLVDGREACSVLWTGAYPKYIRNSIDLSNKRGRMEDVDKTSMSFEQNLMYKLVEGRKDLVWGIIRDICYVCSMPSDKNHKNYTIETEYNGKVYKNVLSSAFRQ